MEIDVNMVEERVKALFEKGYFCSEITAIVLQDILDARSEEVIKSMSTFSGGVGRNGISCGALNGSLAVVGQLFGRGRGGEPDPWLHECIREVHEGFRSHATRDCSGVDCRDIAGVDWWNPDEVVGYFNDMERINKCRRLVVNTIVSTAGILLGAVGTEGTGENQGKGSA